MLGVQMSALGHKRTFAMHKLMSALPPIATAKADIRKRSCPLYTRKRTCALQLQMSALGQKRTSRALFDDLISPRKEFRGHVEPEHSGGLGIDDQLKLVCLHHRQIGWL